jgi:photosystem II stability/assembly factor-like uncharacterized protein
VGGHEGFADAVLQTTSTGAVWTLLEHQFAPFAAVRPGVLRCYGLYSSPFIPGNKVWASTDAGVSWSRRGAALPVYSTESPEQKSSAMSSGTPE